MRRREFLLKSSGLLAAIVPAAAIGKVPCSFAWAGWPSSSSCGGPGAPDWFTNLGNLEAIAPVTNWLGASGVKDPLADSTNSGNTGHLSIIGAWTGMGVDQDSRTAFMMHNGGHNDYWGNEVYSLDLSAEAPAWIRRRNASVSDGSGNITKFSDGRPSSDHTANIHVAAEGRWFTPGMNSTNYLGFGNRSQWWEYDTTTEDYVDLGSSHAGGAGSFGLALWDPVSRQIITVFDNNAVPSIEYQSIDNMSGQPVLQNDNNLNTSSDIMGAVDTSNRILFVRTGDTYWFVRIDTDQNKQADWTNISASGTAANQKHQIHWHEASGAFITWGGGNTILKLTPTKSGGAYTSLTWSGVAVGGVALPSSGPSQGMYDKVNFVQDMGNGDSALVVVPRYANPDTYVIRISGPI